jgi:CheY-like chemotaxis protein
MARVAVLVPDLLFGSKVLSMLGQAGHEVTTCPPGPDAAAAAAGAEVLVVDLTTDEVDGAQLLDAIRAGGASPPRTLAFYSHVDVDVRQRAQDAGFDLVVPRSRMAREGADLVAGLVGART